MRLERLFIEGFGIFRDRQFDFAPGLNIIHGPNEAGKSTLLAFIQHVLFGFPDSRSKVRSYQALRGGRLGGRLVIQDGRGQSYTIERFTGKGGGELSVRLPDGSMGNDTHLLTLLGQASRDVFCKVFAFGLSELQEFNTLKDQGVRAHIYSAGTGGIAITDIERDMGQQADSLFGPRAHQRPINELLKTIDQEERKLKELAQSTAEYNDLVHERDALQERIGREVRQLDEWNKNLMELGRLQEAWEEWSELRDVEQQLEDLEEVDTFPERGTERLEQLQERMSELDKQIDGLEGEIRTDVQKAELLVVEGELLEQGTAIEALRSDRNRYEEQLSELIQRKQELEGAEEALSESLRQLGVDWDEERLEGFDGSIAVQAEIRQFKERLERGERDHHDAGLQVEEAARQLQESQEEIAGAREKMGELEGLDEEQIEARQRALSKVTRLMGRYEALKETSQGVDILPQQAPVNLPVWPVYVLGFLGIAGGVGLSLAGQFVAGAALGGGLVGLAVIYGLAVRWMKGIVGVKEDRKDDSLARERLSALEREIREVAAVLDLKAVPSEEELEQWRERLDKESGDLQAWRMQRVFLEESRNKVKRHEAALEKIQGQLKRLADDLEATREAWRQWLKEHQLLETLLPDDALSVLNEVKTARERLKAVEDLRKRVTGLQQFIREYEERTRAAVETCGRDWEESGSVLSRVDQLFQDLDEGREIERQKTDLEDDKREREGKLEQVRQRRQESVEKQQELFSEARAGDVEEFFHRGKVFQQREEALERQRLAQKNIERLVGVGERYEQALVTLEEKSPAELEEGVQRIREDVARLDGEIALRREQLGGLNQKIDDLEHQEDAAQLRLQKNTHLETLREQAREWCVSSLARAFLGEARQYYEKERRPGVIKEAEGFFQGMTGDFYTQVLAPLDQEDILVEDCRGVVREVDALSRGTAEQLYLALRMGLVREFGQKAEPLPVIVDDIMVNFDPERAQRAAGALGELAQEHQVIVLSCHPGTVELLQRSDDGIHLIELDRESSLGDWVVDSISVQSGRMGEASSDEDKEVLGMRIMEVLAEGDLRIGDLEERVGEKRDKVRATLEMLRDRGQVDTKGSGRGTRWTLIQ